MTTAPTSLGLSLQAAGSTPAVRPGRPGIVLAMLPVIWVLNLLDLFFTLLADTTREFVELNPLAAGLDAHGRVAFKLAMLVVCTLIFVLLRRKRLVLWGCCLLLAVYGVLAIVWLTMFNFLLVPQHLKQLAGLF